MGTEVMAEQLSMMASTLGSRPMEDSQRPPHAVVYASEAQTVGSDDLQACFEATLACPAVAFNDSALEAACGGDAAKAAKLKVWLVSRDLAQLKAGAASG